MGRRSMLQAALAHSRSLVACAALVAAGCTMCPDPYDYSGPVPNGSAPQNDFRARSNGILPLGTAARPFPAVVEAKPRPVPAAPPVREPEPPPVMAEAEDDVLRLSAEEPATDEPAVEEKAADGPSLPAIEPATVDSALGDTAANDTAGSVESEEAELVQPAPAEAEVVPQPVAVPELCETPGWRPRR
jgi:hypothetical protein